MLESIPRLSTPVWAVLVLAFLAGCSASADSEPPIPTVLSPSPEESKRIIQDELDVRWQDVVALFPDAQRPTAEVVRLAAPLEQAALVAECMRAIGYDQTEALDDGGLAWGGVVAGQESAHAVDLYACYAQYPFDPLYNQPPNASQTEWIYFYWTHELTDCLESFGVSVPEAPSRETFRETFGQRGAWDPFMGYDVQDQALNDEILATCVMYPDDYYGVN